MEQQQLGVEEGEGQQRHKRRQGNIKYKYHGL
jgi:hypothetical protein